MVRRWSAKPLFTGSNPVAASIFLPCHGPNRFRRINMPIVTVENAGELTKEQKNKLHEQLTKIVVEITGKPAQYVYTKVVEVPRENFGVGGNSLG